MTDPIADMLIQIKNAQLVRHNVVILPFSKNKMKIAELLKRENYIVDCQKKEHDKKNFLKIRLKYFKKQPAIFGIKRISKPGRRIYVEKDLGKKTYLQNRGGIGVISTSQGIKTGGEAKKEKLGGELLFEIW